MVLLQTAILRPLTDAVLYSLLLSFFFNDTPTTEIYTLSLHDALPISRMLELAEVQPGDKILEVGSGSGYAAAVLGDRKSTRLNSSHVKISYAVFCLKKKIILRYPVAGSLRTTRVWLTGAETTVDLGVP